jgi:hypothetical protein
VLSENTVTAFLEASITGAGLVFAVFALITPIRKTINDNAKERLKRLLEDYSIERRVRGSKRLNQIRRDIRLTKIYPSALNFGLLSAFFFFTATVFDCGAWLVNSSNRNSGFEPLITWNFFIAWASFFFVGIATISQISNMMRKELNI